MELFASGVLRKGDIEPPVVIPPGQIALTNDGTWSQEFSMGSPDNGRTNKVTGSFRYRVNGVNVSGIAQGEFTSGRFGNSRPSGPYRWRVKIIDPNFTGSIEVRARVYNSGVWVNDRESLDTEVFFVINA